jgi:ubiquinone/menaquinone biosynthesis C-methylase UbiE
MKDYARYAYENITPTAYPAKLVSYLANRWGIESGPKTWIMDAGCGRGDFARALVKAGFAVVGFDQSDYCLSYLDQPHRFIQANLEEPWPMDDKLLRVVFFKSVLEHLFMPELALDEAHRTLETRGRVIVLVPPYNRSFWDDPTHRSPFTMEKLWEMLDWCGFTEIEVERFYQVPLLWKHPWFRPFLSVPIVSSRVLNRHLDRSPMILGSGVKK